MLDLSATEFIPDKKQILVKMLLSKISNHKQIQCLFSEITVFNVNVAGPRCCIHFL